MPRSWNLRGGPMTAWEEPTMTKVRAWAGLDVHAASLVACVVGTQSGEMTVPRPAGRDRGVRRALRRVARPDAGGL